MELEVLVLQLLKRAPWVSRLPLLGLLLQLRVPLESLCSLAV